MKKKIDEVGFVNQAKGDRLGEKRKVIDTDHLYCHPTLTSFSRRQREKDGKKEREKKQGQVGQ